MAQARSYDLIVIGSGAAGGVAAQLAASAGKKVALIEGDKPGGSTPNYAGIPTKAMLTAANAYQTARQSKRYGIRPASIAYNYPSIYAWKEKVINSTGVRDSEKAYKHEHIDFIQGWAQFVNKNTISINDYYLKGEHFLIATGSSDRLPDIPGLVDVGFLTSRQILELKSPPKSLIILGGGTVGVEFAELFSSFGTEVTLVEHMERLLPGEDAAVGDLLASVYEDKGVNVVTGARVLRAETPLKKKKVLHLTKGGEEFTVQADEILLAVGCSPNTRINLEAAKVKYTASGVTVNKHLQTSNRHIYAAGDVTGLGCYVNVGIYQARLAVYNMFHRDKQAAEYQVVPRAVSCWPEVASVGLSEQAVAKHRLKHKTVTLPISVIARSMVTGEDVGFVKIVAQPDGLILGASIVAPRASDMIHEVSLAMQYNLTVQDIANTIHAFPSWSDAIRVACSHF